MCIRDRDITKSLKKVVAEIEVIAGGNFMGGLLCMAVHLSKNLRENISGI